MFHYPGMLLTALDANGMLRHSLGRAVIFFFYDLYCSCLTKIINESIVTGKFPNLWKEAIITPVLKNGDRELLKNYRPVSCLAAASKLLEKIVCAQVSEFFEVNNNMPFLYLSHS